MLPMLTFPPIQSLAVVVGFDRQQQGNKKQSSANGGRSTHGHPGCLNIFRNAALAHAQHAGGAAAGELFVVGRNDQCAALAG